MPRSAPSDLEAERVRRKVKLYRNGDAASHPATYSYDSSRVLTFTHLLEEIRNLPLFDDEYIRITRLYTIDGRRIADQTAFETSDLTDFVATGPEGFLRIKGGYQNHIGYQSPTEEHPEDPDHSLDSDSLEYAEENTQNRPILRRPKTNRPIRPQPLHKEMTTDRLSYRELNKQRYGELPRLYGDRIENRVDNGTVKRIYLYRNGDPFFKPKMYVYRSKVHKKWEKFLEDLENMAPPIRGGGVRHLYTLRGNELTSFDQLRDKTGYVVAGFDGYLEVKGGYDMIGKVGHRTASAIPEIVSRPFTQQQGRPRTGFARGPGERLLDRRLPEPTFFFVFKNGDGLEAKRFLFTPQQMEKGMSWLMEQIGRRFGIYAHKLVTMDNREITDPRQFINRGAYIIIPFGEKFTENWHHFPEMAIDTSVFSRRDAGSRSQSRYSSRPRTGHSRTFSRLARSRSVVSRRSLHSARYDERHAKQLLHHDLHHNAGDRQRSGSASSHCSFCDLIERHRQKHHLHSAEDINDKTFLSKSQAFSPENPPSDYDLQRPGQPHLYSAEDVNNILPPRPVTSARLRLSPDGVPDYHGYPVRSSSVGEIMPRPSIDDHGPMISNRRGSALNVNDLARQRSNLDHVHEIAVSSRSRLPAVDRIDPPREKSNLPQPPSEQIRPQSIAKSIDRKPPDHKADQIDPPREKSNLSRPAVEPIRPRSKPDGKAVGQVQQQSNVEQEQRYRRVSLMDTLPGFG